MPEGPEVKRNSVDLSKFLSASTVEDAEVVSGRYSRNPLVGLDEFKSCLPTRVNGAGCHGKFMYILFSNGWNLWSTLGMSGIWSKETTKHTRFKLVLNDSSDVYYNDIRNFGTLKFVYGASSLVGKLETLGLDLLSHDIDPEEFIQLMRKKDGKNICKVMMDQSVLAGVGNYVKAEALWMSEMDPRKKVEDFEDFHLLSLKESVESVLRSSYEHGGATFLTHSDFLGRKGNYTGRFLCYNRKVDAEGNAVEKIKTPDGRTTHWSPERQGDDYV